MSFYAIKYNYETTKLIEGFHNVAEIGGYTYFVGRIFNDDIDRQSLCISKRDLNGNIIWERQYFIGTYTFLSSSLNRRLFQLDNGNLSLFFWNDDMLLSMNIDENGNFLSTKKYYDKDDTPTSHDLYVKFTIAKKISDGNIFITINERHVDSFVTVESGIRFLKIQLSTGNVLVAKKHSTTVTDSVLSLEQVSFNNDKIVCVGVYNQSDFKKLCVITLNNDLDLLDSYRFEFNYPSSPARLSGDNEAISNIIDNKVYLLAASGVGSTSVVHLIQVDLNTAQVLRSKSFSVQPWTGYYSRSLWQDTDGVYITSGFNIYKFSLLDLEILWGKKIVNIYDLNVHNIDKNVIYADYRRRESADGTIVENSHTVYRSNKELEICHTVPLIIPGNIDSPVSTIPISITLVNDGEISYPSFSVSDSVVLNTTTEELCPPTGGEYDLEQSTITAVPSTINADGIQTSLVTVQLKDAAGNDITVGGETVVIFTSSGMISGVTDNNDGSYIALLSSTITGSAVLTFSVNGQNATNTTGVKFIEGSGIPITEVTSLQSPNFYLQSVGSLGLESAKGMHLRWIFGGALGEKHLPKRDYAATTHNFNKPNDVVTVYRTPYQKVQFTLNLFERPNELDDANRLWIYNFVNERKILVYFRNASKYDQVRTTINPLLNPSGFIESYGSELIEVENREELFFAAELKAVNTGFNSSVQTESLSVPQNTPVAIKVVSSRQTFSSSELNAIRLVCENGRSIRFKPANCQVSEIRFEFYGDFIATVNKANGWQTLGDYALTLENNIAFSMLEPAPGLVHGHWQRFNNDAYVNVQNYKTKWEHPTEPWDRDIKQIVKNYILLSDVASNPTAIESVPFENDDDEPLEISNLDQLNFAAYDYHIARMLGLGTLDVDTVINDGSYVYVAEYTTFGDLEDGQGKREVHHLSMGLPTSINDQRLPLPVDIRTITPGAFFGNEGEPVNLTEEDGYTHNGEARYVTLYTENQPVDLIGVPFYITANEFSLDRFTYPVYSGVEYQQSNAIINVPDNVWQKPELPNDPEYLNAVPSGETAHYESRVLQIPDTNQPFYVHKQNINGWHYYSSYGINWFSRSTSSTIVRSIQTQLQPKNPLLPPSNISPLLIRKESPLFLTSQEEQDRLYAIDPNHDDEIAVDETLIRITFDYNTQQELIVRKMPLDSAITNVQILDPANAHNPAVLYPDNEEILAEEVDIFFRPEVPNNISGQVLSVTDDNTSELLSVVQTGDYYISSVDQTVSPILIPGTEDNYIGGAFLLGNQRHVIHSVVQGTDGPIFSVYKKEISDAIINDIPSADADNLQPIEITGDGFFMAVENMQTASSWGTPSPLSLNVNVAVNSEIHREILEIPDDDGNIERQVEKSRGIWSDANLGDALVEEVLEPVAQLDSDGNPIFDSDGNVVTTNVHNGTYKVTFNGIQLPQHTQHNDNDVSVEWYRGVARLFTVGSIVGSTPIKTRKVLPVIKIEEIGTTNDLVIYINDPSFSSDSDYDAIQTGNNVSVNFYPGYKVYLYHDDTFGLNEPNILPEQGEGTRYSIFGLRSRDLNLQQYASKISIPSLMFAHEMIEALPPEQPEGALYATRPDFFGRSTYTLTTKYQHQPHGVLFYRANDEALLNVLYKKTTIRDIREILKGLGGNEESYFTNRWQNFLNFSELMDNGDYTKYPPEDIDPDNSYKFPNPDKLAFFEFANEIIDRLNSSLIDPPSPPIPLFNVDESDPDTDIGAIAAGDPRIFSFVKGAIYNAFVPLTEVPIVYQFIKDNSYTPINKKQIVRDRNGYVLSPTHEDFEMAPMMKTIGTNPHETQFTDFNLDGTSNNIYFYGVREVSSQMKMGAYSPFLGPIKLVNTNAPEAPEVKRIMPVLENVVLETPPSIQLEINAYPEIQNIKKLTVYRSFNKLDAQSIRTMQLVKVVDLETEGIINEAIWRVHDLFEDLAEVPFGEGFFYRITVSRKVEYADKDGNVIIEYQPSQASKIVASMMVEVANPPAPILSFISDPIAPNQQDLPNVVLQWQKTCYNGKYHLYKMNSQGNWVKIHELNSNQDTISLPLADTDLNSGTLQVRNDEYDSTYHHFKVVAENTSGMFSTEEHILTILENIDDLGIGTMIIGSSFIVK